MDIDDVHDRALVLGQLRRGLLGDEEGRAQVRADELLPVRRLHRAHRHGEERRGVVHQDVQAPEALQRSPDQRSRCDRREQLGLDPHSAFRPQGIKRGFKLHRVGLGIAVMEEHVCAGGVQPARDRRADAPRAARHERRLALEGVLHEAWDSRVDFLDA
jgi:hypothetical protein